MTAPPLAAFYSTELPYHVLAVVGGFAAGGAGVGWLVQLFARLAFHQAVPRWPLWAVRTLGGVAAGWIVYLCLFGGGTGPGGPGGIFGFLRGGNQPSKDAQKDAKDAKAKTPDQPTPKVEPPKPRAADKDQKAPGQGETLRVEVLGEDTVAALAKKGATRGEGHYRVRGQAGLLTLQQAQQLLRERRAGKPPLHTLVIVVYRDSPAADTHWVKDLQDYAGGLGSKDEPLRVDVSLPDSNAPVD
jgi:hypothetical protein